MGQLVFTDAKVVVNSVDLSDHVKSVTVNYKAENKDKTAMGDTSRRRMAGLKDFDVQVEFHQDYAAAKVDATLFPLVGAAAFAISVVPVKTDAVSATNPNYNGNVLLENYSPVTAQVGELGTVTVGFPGDGDLARSTS